MEKVYIVHCAGYDQAEEKMATLIKKMDSLEVA